MVDKCNQEAYPSIGLRQHNACVGASAYMLFRDRLDGLGSRSIVGRLEEITTRLPKRFLLYAVVIAGSMHDIGKSSPVYPFKGHNNRASYAGHEIAGAFIIHKAAFDLIEKEMKLEALLLELAAWAVARHHSAMIERHPADLKADLRGKALKALLDIVKRPECLSTGIPMPLRGSWVEKALLETIKKMRSRLYSRDSRDSKKIIGGLLNWVLEELYRYPQWLKVLIQPTIPPGRWAAYVSIASGAVIVADILVASAEGRKTDDRVNPAYVEWWRRELSKEASENVDKLTKNPKECESILSEVLEPLLSDKNKPV